MEPTVGRIVHYVAPGSADGRFPVGAHRAAIITEVLDADAGVVSLCVFNPTGLHFNASITYSAEPTGYTWHWPEREDAYDKPALAASPYASWDPRVHYGPGPAPVIQYREDARNERINRDQTVIRLFPGLAEHPDSAEAQLPHAETDEGHNPAV